MAAPSSPSRPRRQASEARSEPKASEGVTAKPDPALCPLCGQPNACALASASGAAAAECWCASQRFEANLLARLAPAQIGRACICRRCQREGAAAEDAG
jgi:hypothetical protein